MGALESRRTQLHRSEQRASLILAEADVYAWSFRALERATEKGFPEAARTAAWLIESLRKSSLAEMLRGEELDLPERAQQLVEQLDEIERGDPSSAVLDDRREELRSELAAAVSDEFAAAYVPAPTPIGTLEAVARDCGDVLSFYMPTGSLGGWRVWIRRNGEFELGRVEIEDGPAATLLGQLETGDTQGRLAFHAAVGSASATVWARLAEALLPAELAQTIGSPRADGWAQPLLVAPDGVLGLIPWSALQIEGVPLGTRAAIQIVPTLGVVEESEEVEGGRAVVAHLDPSLDGHAAERQMLERHLDLKLTERRSDFLAALGDRRYRGAYVAAHGDGVGLDQYIEFEDGRLTAGTALRGPWPSWTFFASCLVGRVPVRTGQEPLGLPISCVLAGSASVLAAAVEVESGPLPEFAEPLVAGLAAGEHPARALARAQRSYLAENPAAGVAKCLGFVCLTRSPARSRLDPGSAGLGSWEDIVEAALAVAEEDPAEARRLFERGMEIDPEPTLRARYAHFLSRSGEDPALAGKLLTGAAAAHPEHREVWATYAWWLSYHGDDPDATRPALERVLEIDPDDRWAIPEYARYLRYHTDDLATSARFYRRALEAQPHSAAHASALGEVLERSGDTNGAREMFERALCQDPDRGLTSRLLASLLGRTEPDPERIARLFERSLRVDPEGATPAYNRWSMIAARELQDRELAREVLERARVAVPEEANFAINLSWLLFEADEAEKAIPLAEEALELSDDPVVELEAWFYLAVLGEPDGGRAKGEVERLLTEGVRSPDWELSRILDRVRERDGADVEWAEATAATIVEREPAEVAG